MANAISDLSAATTTALGLSNLILVSPSSFIQGYQPYPSSGPIATRTGLPFPDPFLFHYEGEQTVTCTSDITDHYVEDNTAIQDQISLKPIEITTQGFIGELNDVPPFFIAPLRTIANKLTSIVAYAPAASVTAQLAYNQAFQLYQTAQAVLEALPSSWTGVESQNKQQKAFQQFYGWWRDRRFFYVQTPWAVFSNMAIKSLRPIQSAETNVITNFEITFKQIQTTQTIILPPRSSISQGQAITNSSPTTDLGVSQPSVNLSQPTAFESFSGLPL